MKLKSWMKDHEKTQADLAQAICRDKTRANRICNGAIPNEEEMGLIVEWTQGLVEPNDFYDVVLSETRPVEADHRNT
jgi:hypothetical protein